nr:MAG TPA: protein of unknown function DUF3452 [Caudoviricetes sp.]
MSYSLSSLYLSLQLSNLERIANHLFHFEWTVFLLYRQLFEGLYSSYHKDFLDILYQILYP